MLTETCPEMEGRQILKNLIGEFFAQQMNLREYENERRAAKDEMFAQLNRLRKFADNAANENKINRRAPIEKNEFEQLLLECSKEIRDLIMKINSVDQQIDFLQCSWANWHDKLNELDDNWRRRNA